MRVEHSLLETATTLSKEKVRGLQADLANQDKLAHSFEDGIDDVQVNNHTQRLAHESKKITCWRVENEQTPVCVFVQRRIQELSIEQREMDHLLDELLSLEAQCHQASEQCQRLRETALHKAKAVVYDAKHLDAGMVAIMGEDRAVPAFNDNDDATATTTASRSTTKELSIDLIWQAQLHATDSVSESYAPSQPESQSEFSSVFSS